jgi:hypothetical protein
MDTKTCYLTPRFASECLLSVPHAQRLNGLLKQNHILDTQQCKTIMTLSDHKRKQVVGDTIQKCFLPDFQTMFIGILPEVSAERP